MQGNLSKTSTRCATPCQNSGMLTQLALLTSMAVSAPPAPPYFAGNLAGNLSVVQGTLVGNKTPGQSLQSLTLTVGGTNHTYTNIYLVGSATQNSWFTGTPVTILQATSAPLKGTYSVLNAIVDQGYSDAAARRTVAISAGGALTYGVAVAGTPNLRLMMNPFTLAGCNFANGATVYLSAFPPTYSIPFPTPGGASSATVWYPNVALPPFSFTFNAYAPHTNLTFGGQGTPKSLLVQGSWDGTATTFAAATFNITDGTNN